VTAVFAADGDVDHYAAGQFKSSRMRSNSRSPQIQVQVQETNQRWLLLLTMMMILMIGDGGLGQVDGEEWRPADNEAADDDADRLGRFLLLVETAQLRDDVKLGEPRRDQRRSLLGRRRH